MEKARRPHVPAFGEWNYYFDELPVTEYTQEGSDVWFKFSPPQRKPTKKVRRDVVLEMQYREVHGRRQGRVSDAGANTPRKARVVKAVDEDLYQVPPDLLCQKPRRKRMERSLWMGCLGLNCIA